MSFSPTAICVQFFLFMLKALLAPIDLSPFWSEGFFLEVLSWFHSI